MSSAVIALGVVLLGGILPNIKIELKPSASSESMAKPVQPEMAENPQVDAEQPDPELDESIIPTVVEPSQKALELCREELLFESIETIDYELVICHESASSKPSIFYKYDKLTGSTLSLPLNEMQMQGDAGTYRYAAENSDFSYLISAATGVERELGDFIVRQGSVELVREPIASRTRIQ